MEVTIDVLVTISSLIASYPAVENELAAIRKHLQEQNILLSVMPQVGPFLPPGTKYLCQGV